MVPPGDAAKGNYLIVDEEPVCAKCYKRVQQERGDVGVLPLEAAPADEGLAAEVAGEPEAEEPAAAPPEPEPEPEPELAAEDLPDLPPSLAAQLRPPPPPQADAAEPGQRGPGGKMPIYISLGVGAGLLLVVVAVAVVPRIFSGAGDKPPAPGGPEAPEPAPPRPKPGPGRPEPDPESDRPDPRPEPRPPTPNPNPTPTPAPPGSKTVELTPVADTYVKSGKHKDKPYGKAEGLAVKKGQRIAYLRFDLAAVRKKKIVKARLRLFVSWGARKTPGRHAVSFVADDAWSEDQITWEKRPKAGDKLGEYQATLRQFTEVDVTAAARREAAGDGKLSLCVSALSKKPTSGITYVSRDSKFRKNWPALLITCQ
jgi:hypothetical protein